MLYYKYIYYISVNPMPIVVKELTVKTKASPESIWRLWSDVSRWGDWDDEVASARLYGDFILSQIGDIKPKNGPIAKMKIVELTILQSFSTTTKLPFARMRFDHAMEKRDDRLSVTHRIVLSGPLGFFFACVLGKNLAKGLESALPKLISIAEAYEIKSE